MLDRRVTVDDLRKDPKNIQLIKAYNEQLKKDMRDTVVEALKIKAILDEKNSSGEMSQEQCDEEKSCISKTEIFRANIGTVLSEVKDKSRRASNNG